MRPTFFMIALIGSRLSAVVTMRVICGRKTEFTVPEKLIYIVLRREAMP